VCGDMGNTLSLSGSLSRDSLAWPAVDHPNTQADKPPRQHRVGTSRVAAPGRTVVRQNGLRISRGAVERLLMAMLIGTLRRLNTGR